jgi:flagellar biosynthesis/type III secretory pathway protein FliH
MTKAMSADNKAAEKPDKKRNHYDSPWKRIINRHFRSFMDFFFPEVSQQINWNEKYRFMDKEMQSIQDPVDNSETEIENKEEPKVSYLQRFRERGVEEGKKDGLKEGKKEGFCRTIAIAQTPEEVLKVIPNSSS